MKEKERYELIGYCSYRDTETGVIGDNFVGVLNKQDQKIKDLEAKLAERTEQLKIALKDFNDIQQENDKLAQQLAESENKVKGFVELFDKKQHENYEQFCKITQLKQQLAEKEKEETKRMEDFEKGCQEYYKSNQKAIEELRLALDNFRNRPTYFDVARQELRLSEQDKQFIDFINNRIKELGGGENE